MPGLQGLVRPPFANYDIVVYFGGGLFFVPFLYRYLITPLGIPLPRLLLNEMDQVTLEIVRALSIVVAIYVLGHLVAYLGSQLIEKAVDRFLGKISSSILVSLKSDPAARDEQLRQVFRKQWRKIRAERSLFPSLVRAAFHLPNAAHYWVIYKAGVFGYLDSRIPSESFEKAAQRYRKDIIPDGDISVDTKWYKSLEYYVINNIPAAVPRMYNYLIIAGFFRSLSFVFGWSSLMVCFYAVAYLAFGAWPLGKSGPLPGEGATFCEWFALSTSSVFCLMLYLKFQRRYAEEAIMALAFDRT